ncbi:MAG: hypothetical protein KDC85_18050 [Saprospiraceae bacterium]|nr:hypothetical protein [Saprospiraceae bacterium]MCB9326476.1 hypothetical protein [Lewinellaceae bacterium]
MKLFNLALLLLFIFPGKNHPTVAPDVFHKYHIGKCLIDYNQREKAIQVSQFIFLDDLEAALRAQGADKLFLCTEKEAEKAETYLARYLAQHLQFEVNGKAKSFVFIGKESSEDLLGVWCYLEITEVAPLKEVRFRNDLLMEIYDDQKNVIIFKGPNNKEASFLFEKGKAEDKLAF